MPHPAAAYLILVSDSDGRLIEARILVADEINVPAACTIEGPVLG